MKTSTNTIKIQNETLGVILDETFVNDVQFKLFLKMINGSLNSDEPLTFFNGVDFLINIPSRILKDSVITTKSDIYTLTDQVITKSKIEQLV